MLPTPPCKRTSRQAEYCMSWRKRPEKRSSSIALMANARPWRWKPRRKPESRQRATSRAALTPGGRRAERWSGDRAGSRESQSSRRRNSTRRKGRQLTADLTHCRSHRNDAGRCRTPPAALGVQGIESSRVLSSSQSTGEAHPDDQQHGYFPTRKAGSGRPSVILRFGGGLRDRAELARLPPIPSVTSSIG